MGTQSNASSLLRLRQIAAGLVIVLTAFLLPLGTAAPASAATANAGIYGVAPKWGGWVCPGWANKVVDVRYWNHTTGRNGGDGNDDIVWIPVRKNAKNHITIGVKCRFGTYMAMNYVIKPTRHKQTFWFNLNGSYKHN